jgi:DNA sulfur modification protein DndD
MIQSEAQEIFQSLISKSSQFTDVRLSDEYRLEVVDRWGYPARPEMSAGERQVLSLGFIAGMAKISGMEAPLVMDTPFGRLHSTHRENIVERLPELTGQWALFVQDEELRGTARKKLEQRIGVEYQLEFDHATGSTRIVELTS